MTIKYMLCFVLRESSKVILIVQIVINDLCQVLHKYVK